MASFSADLYVEGQRFPVVQCTYGTNQVTDGRGRVVAKVRYGPVELLLDVPEGDFLLMWANTPQKRLAADVVFKEAKGGGAQETLSLAAAYCVGYQETFVSGDGAMGAYQCHLTLIDPNGFTLHAGSPMQALLITPSGLPTLTTAAEEASVVESVAKPAAETIVKETGPSVLGGLARLAALLPELIVATAVAVLVPTNSPDDPGYKSEWDLIRRNAPLTDKDRAELAYLEQRHEEGTLTAAEEQQLLGLLARVRGMHLQSLAALRTLPSRLPNIAALPRGVRAKIDPRDELAKQQALMRENESADILAQAGYDVEQNPLSPNPPKKPDYRIEGKIFDNYAPTSSSPRNIWSNTGTKVEEEQTTRVVLNLRGSKVDVPALTKQFQTYPIPKLEEVIIITKDGGISHLLP